MVKFVFRDFHGDLSGKSSCSEHLTNISGTSHEDLSTFMSRDFRLLPSVNEVFDLPGCYAELIGGELPTFRDSRSVSSSRVKYS